MPYAVAPDRDTRSDAGFVYHATNLDRAHDIALSGLLPHRPNKFTDQRTWPDGKTERRVYFTPRASSAWQFAPEHGRAVLLRAPAEVAVPERGTGDCYSRKAVPPSKLEIDTTDGWMPIARWRELGATETAAGASESRQRTLVRLGGATSFDIVGVGVRRAPGSMLYDATGHAWPRCSLLFMSFARAGRPAEPTSFMREWVGDGPAREGDVDLPPRDLSSWTQVGRASAIYYTRDGERADDYEHPFDGLGGASVISKILSSELSEDELPIVYRRGNAMRCDLGSGCEVSALGFVYP